MSIPDPLMAAFDTATTTALSHPAVLTAVVSGLFVLYVAYHVTRATTLLTEHTPEDTDQTRDTA